MFEYKEYDYLALVHVSKAIIDSERQEITYHFDGGKKEAVVLRDPSKFQEASDTITESFVEIEGIWYNVGRIGLMRAYAGDGGEGGIGKGSNKVWLYFVGGKEAVFPFGGPTNVHDIVDKLEPRFILINGTWYNSEFLHIAEVSPSRLTITYEWLGRERMTVEYKDSSEYDSALEKLANAGQGRGTCSGGGKRTATPSFSIRPGAVEEGTKVMLSCATEGATIHYTTDGSDATLSSPVYAPGTEISVPDDGITIKAVAVLLGLATSSQATATFTIAPDEPYYYAGVYNNPDEDTDIIPEFTKSMLAGLVNCVSGLAEHKEFGGTGDEHEFYGVHPINGGRIVYAYPASLGDIGRFVTNGFGGDIGDSFTLQKQTFKGTEYNIYVLTDMTCTDGVPYAFI